MRIRHLGRQEKIELQMTPMIDIVFQLLIFFVMTFKIVQPEGDFNIRMPSPSEAAISPPSESPLLRLELIADAEGNLDSMTLNGDPMNGFDELRATIRSMVGDGAGPSAEPNDQQLQIDADYNLLYKYTMEAVTHVSGYYDPDTKQTYPLIERLQFSPPN